MCIRVSLIPLGIFLHSSFPFVNITPHATRMSSPSLRDIFAQREKQLREYIFFQPVSNLVDNPWAVANAIDKFAETQGRMMIFKKPKVEVTRAQLTANSPATHYPRVWHVCEKVCSGLGCKPSSHLRRKGSARHEGLTLSS